MSRRPDKDSYFIAMAELVATRSTCLRRSVGCVLANERGHVLSTGYNGVAMGMPHCNERVDSPVHRLGDGETVADFWPHACAGASAPSGSALTACGAIHAEQNALLQCRDVWEIETCYVTACPCVTCAKLLLNTSVRRIVYAEPYAAEHMAMVAELFDRGHRTLVQHRGAGKVGYGG